MKPLEMRDVWKAYRPGHWVLRGLDLEVGPGELIVVVGPNGSGKTTLLRIAAGLLRPSRGVVRVCGREPWSVEAKRCRGVVMHWSFLYDELTVAENLELYASLAGLKGYRPESDGAASALGLRERLGEPVGWLSFGWRKRSDLARALLGSPRLLLLDEPLTGLDSSAAARLLEMLKGFVEAGGAVVATTPKGEEELLRLATRAYRLSGGRLEPLG